MTSHTPPPDKGFQENELASDMDVAQVHESILREKNEPKTGSEPLPLSLIVVFFAIVFWAGLYLAYYSGGFRADVFNPSPSSAGGDNATQVAAIIDPKVLGKRIFTKNCVVCHQSTGLGTAGVFPPLVGSEWVVGTDWQKENHLIRVLLSGLQGPIQVKGVTYNNSMPPWIQLSDEEIASVLTYIRSEWGNAASPINTETVKEVRDESAGRTEPWSQKELQAVPASSPPPAVDTSSTGA